MSDRLTLSACGALLVGACAPIAVTDQSTIEAHRAFEIAPIRGADACIFDGFLSLGQWAERARLTLQVDFRGHTRVETAHVTTLLESPSEASGACLRQLQAAIANWRYRPFSRYGLPSAARITERVMLIPAERWHEPRRAFPAIDDIANVRLTLKRWEDLYPCPAGRNPNYELQLRGDGHFTLTEVARFRRPASAREGNIDTAAFRNLVEHFRAADFFSLREEYSGGWTHQTSQTLDVEIGGESSRVHDYIGETAGMPLIVRELQDAVDQTAGLEPLSCPPSDFLARALDLGD